ncbi:pleckstrin homology domain-containing family A member 7-like isoform X2 [Boleophthalmus pectinirostris]|uniref:pleckstrin homology domain-containing family A member 7-like isoform X2 n=1 Tax=Boleophthalmus pectinirostris TaxID=150288 RepID=UPI00242F0515|nr:pleckstrin homology domain-containing family A member 7-like isoform X2 [Boleophthalmus pectinirostris]
MADLPKHWAYGVRADGRVFFISDRTRTTTWLHPRTGLPVNSGHMIRSDLPRGWEEGFTSEGASYFIDHNERRTTFIHPQTGVASSENSAFILHELPQSRVMSKPELSDSASTNASNNNKVVRSGSKLHSFGKRQLSVKRNPNVPVEVRGWLYKQDSSGMRLWKRKWFVLSDFCLFYYKDSREQSVLGSIPLPSYEVCPVGTQDHISRKYAFKAEHLGMRTYFFSAETQEDMNAWIRAMNRASRVQTKTQDQTQGQTQSQTQGQTQDQTGDQTQDQTGDHTGIQTKVRNGVRKVQNGVHCGTNTSTDKSSELLDLTRASEKTQVGEVQSPNQDPVQDSPLKIGHVSTATTQLTTPPEETAPAASQNRFPVSTPSPILEPNGIASGTYQTTPPPDTPPGSVYRQATPPGRQVTPTGSTQRQATPTGSMFRQATPPNSSLTRNSVREQVQNWIKVQRDDKRDSLRRTPPAQFSPIEPPHQYNAPGGRVGEYRYAQDRLSHFGLSDSAAPPPFWRLYEWQQRHQYRHGNPTAPLYSPAPLHPYGSRPLAATDQSRAPTPRCIDVPPSTADVPPSLPSGPIGRRPHTPAERLTVRPTNERAAEGGAFTAAPRRSQSQFFKASTLERRSMPVSGYMTHTVSAPSLHGKTVDDSFLQLKKDLEYLDLKMGGKSVKELKPLRVAESDIDVKLSRLCEQDKTLKDLEARISALHQDKDQLEAVLAFSHQQMEQFSDTASRQKISLQQKVLQEDLVQVRAQISRAYTDMSRSLEEFVLLEKSVEQLRSALQTQLSSSSQAERAELKRELWRVEDVLAGLSRPEQHTERKLVPSVQESVPSTNLLQTVPNWSNAPPPPRPPLPCGFYDEDDARPEVPPLPREAAVIRHTSVRGLKRQSDERRRDRDGGDWKFQSDLRSFLSEPELPLEPERTSGLGGSSSGLNQSSVSAFVTLRRGDNHKERPKSALECTASSPALDTDWAAAVQSRGRMSAHEQAQRLQQRTLGRDRQKSVGQSERSSTTPRSEVFDGQQERPMTEGQSDEGRAQGEMVQSEKMMTEAEPEEFDLDISKELSRPEKVQIPERLDPDPEEVLSPDEQKQRQERAERIRNMLTKSSFQVFVDFSELDTVLQQQQKIMKQASIKGRLLRTGKAAAEDD